MTTATFAPTLSTATADEPTGLEPLRPVFIVTARVEPDRQPRHEDYPSVAAYLDALDAWKDRGPWVPAHNGTEIPVRYRSGKTLLYCYQPRSRKHAFLDCETDLILDDATALAWIA